MSFSLSFPSLTAVGSATDAALYEVYAALQQIPNLQATIGRSLRQAFDEVIDGARTGRYCIEQLEKTEKTYIGTKVEIVLRNELELERGQILDNLICGHEVDTKFSLSGNWMIPREAVGELCILVRADDNTGLFSVGLLRMSPAMLTNGQNQDGKKSVSAAGKQCISWIIYRAPMPRNFLLDLPDSKRTQIMSPRSGMERIRELFRNVTGQIIPRSAIEQVAQQKDPLRRARQAKAYLLPEGFQVLCATYEEDRAEFHRSGFTRFRDDDWLSLDVARLTRLPPRF